MDKLKEKIQKLDWWEISYLIIYGVIFAHEFEYTTMFGIEWPPKIGYLFIAVSTLYTIAKFIWHNTYTKKEMILSILIIVAFVAPAILSDYSYIFWVGFLIVGAKDVDFKKILKVYLVISITYMVVAFSASQYGLIENLQYETARGDELVVRHSYGIVYPTDFAAHLFFIVLAIIELYEKKMSTFCKVWLCLLVACMVYMTSNAQTTTLCLIGFAILCVCEQVLQKHMKMIERLFRWVPMVCAAFFLSVSYFYNPEIMWMFNLNRLLTTRLEIAKEAFELYTPKLFGQYIYEVGCGSELGWKIDYFFLDDSYIRILLKYGIMLFVLVFVMLCNTSKKAAKDNHYILVMIIVTISVHSIMEHRLVDIAYNPMMLALFATLTPKEQMDRRKHV